MPESATAVDSEPEPKPQMLLHVCCAPCSAHVIRVLQERFALTAYYYNPNIHPQEEYRRRASELLHVAGRMQVPLIIAPYRPEEWEALVAGHEADHEGGARCEICFRSRLERAARLAADHRHAWLATTLTISVHKDAECINRVGRELAAKYGVSWYEADFKKDGGFDESVRLSKQLGLYRQDYCGCIFSLQERERRRADRSGSSSSPAS